MSKGKKKLFEEAVKGYMSDIKELNHDEAMMGFSNFLANFTSRWIAHMAKISSHDENYSKLTIFEALILHASQLLSVDVKELPPAMKKSIIEGVK